MGGIQLTESQIELQILDYLVRVRKLFAWKNPTSGYFDPRLKRFRKQVNPYARNGVPDVICVHEGRFIGFEVKSSTGRQSDSQKEFERDLCKAGGQYYLVRSLEEVQEALKN